MANQVWICAGHAETDPQAEIVEMKTLAITDAELVDWNAVQHRKQKTVEQVVLYLLTAAQEKHCEVARIEVEWRRQP